MKKIVLLLAILMLYKLHTGYSQIPTITYLNLPIGAKYSKFTHMHQLRGRLYFFAYDVNHRPKLMTSDGTQTGTSLVLDLIPGVTFEDDYVYWGKAIDSMFFFYTSEKPNSTTTIFKLWISDGTATGTYALNMRAGNPIAYKGKLFFSGADSLLKSNGLWVSDGTQAGTKLFKEGFCGGGGTTIGELNGNLLFSIGDCSYGSELWITDGTLAGTQLLKDIRPGHYPSGPSKGVVLGSKYYFMASDSDYRLRVWYTDGTTNGTALLNQDLVISENLPEPLFEYNGKIYISAIHNKMNVLYVSDGTDTGTHLIAYFGDVNTCEKPRHFYGYKNNVYFSADSGNTYRKELWTTDGTSAGTQLFKDIFPGSGSSSPLHFRTYKNYLYFRADKSIGNYYLFQSDGTATGTIDISFALIEDDMTEYKGALYAAIDYALLKIQDTSGLTVPENHLQPAFSLYPNPANGNFTIELQDADFKNASVTVYNLLGASVYQSPITNRESQITLNQPAGTYMVKLQLDDAVLTKRLVVE